MAAIIDYAASFQIQTYVYSGEHIGANLGQSC